MRFNNSRHALEWYFDFNIACRESVCNLEYIGKLIAGEEVSQGAVDPGTYEMEDALIAKIDIEKMLDSYPHWIKWTLIAIGAYGEDLCAINVLEKLNMTWRKKSIDSKHRFIRHILQNFHQKLVKADYIEPGKKIDFSFLRKIS